MKKWVIMDGNLVKAAGRGRILPDGAEEVQTRLSIAELARAMTVGGTMVRRPASPTVVGTGPFSIGPCAAGTVIEIEDLAGGAVILTHSVAVDDTTEEIDLPDPGRYRIEVRGPLPAWPSRREVIVE